MMTGHYSFQRDPRRYYGHRGLLLTSGPRHTSVAARPTILLDETALHTHDYRLNSKYLKSHVSAHCPISIPEKLRYRFVRGTVSNTA